ncbi:Helicase ATP-binding domain-containing protein [Plasmodiophora brassicae]
MREIPFPFEPYDVQRQFMSELFDCLETGRLAMFESPTGTGKSMSIICAALHWLTTSTTVKAKDAAQTTSSAIADCPDWVKEFSAAQSAQEQEHAAQAEAARKLKRRRRIERANTRNKRRNDSRKKVASGGAADPDDEFLADWEPSTDQLCSAEQWKSRLADSGSEPDDDSDIDEDDKPVQIIYATRTHSQTRQFLHEFVRSPFGSRCSCVPLSSRQHLCTNPGVRSLPPSSINDRCIELIGSKTSSEGKQGCEFLSPSLQRLMASFALEHPSDLEDLFKKGAQLKACAYFGARRAARTAQLLVVPYPSLLSETTRETLGVNIKGNIVIIDEAHNLVEAINEMNSVSLTCQGVERCQAALEAYLKRYASRLKPSNAMYVKRVLFIAKSLARFLKRIDPSKATHVATVNDFIFDVGIDNQNLWDTSAWMDASGIVRKLIGFMDKNMEDAGKGADSSFTALAAFKSFFFSLTNANDDGRVVIMPSTSSLRYLNLNPSSSFSAVVKDARAVILAGGTMRPYSFYVDQLFPGRSVHTFSCGHVVAPDNVAAIVIGTGPTGRSLNFRFTSRSQLDTLMELGRTLVNLCSIAPAGLVCFFSSYAYEDAVFKFLDSNGFLQRIRSRKSVHREPRDAADVGSTLTRFSEAVARAGGAMLSCVVGGKMSEGINFSDDLARLVVVVGMPYANPNDAELRERMAYMDQAHGKGAGERYFETLCMRAVNQSIGRAIRHRGDYSGIVLLDERYARPTIIEQFPQWIRSRTATPKTFGEAYASLAKFYKSRAPSR